MIAAVLEDLWPPFGLTIVTPRLELRLPREEDLAALAEVAARGVHPLTNARSSPPGRTALHRNVHVSSFATTGNISPDGVSTPGVSHSAFSGKASH